MKFLFIKFLLIYSTASYASEKACEANRAEEVLKRMNLVKEDVSKISYEDSCTDESFCFEVKLLRPKELKSNLLTADTEIGICSRKSSEPDLATISLPEGKSFVVDKDIACGGTVLFDERTQSFCRCFISQPFKYYKYELPVGTEIVVTSSKSLVWFGIKKEISVGEVVLKPGKYMIDKKTQKITNLPLGDMKYCTRD